MRALSRLFGRRNEVPRAEPPAEPDAVVATAEPAATPEPAASTARQAPAAEAPEVPLRSLTRYQQDPAFQNFVQKLKRPPGARERRRLNPDELERKR